METAVIPKQFIKVSGDPVFIRSLRKFLSVPEIDHVVISMNMDWADEYVRLLDEYEIDRSKVTLTAGGDSRFTSLINIVNEAYRLSNGEDAAIVTHDCARIFVSERIIKDNLTAIQDNDMVTTSIPVIDTILQSDDGKNSTLVPDRSKLWADQGPQTFYIRRFLKYVSMIPKDDIVNYMEAGKLYLAHGCRIGIVRGERFNFKITNDIDLQYAEFLIERGIVK